MNKYISIYSYLDIYIHIYIYTFVFRILRKYILCMIIYTENDTKSHTNIQNEES